MTEPAADSQSSKGIDRRTLLRHGAVAGAAVWAVPVVQVVGMRMAEAQSASNPGTIGARHNPAYTGQLPGGGTPPGKGMPQGPFKEDFHLPAPPPGTKPGRG